MIEQSPQGLGSLFEEDKFVFELMPADWTLTEKVMEITGYSYTDLIFVLNRLMSAGHLERHASGTYNWWRRR